MNIPCTEIQIAGFRASGATSQGRVAEHGKAAAARNSVRHGLLGNSILLPGESAEASEFLYQSHLEEFAPRTASEFETLRQRQNAPDVAAHAMPFRAWTALHDTVSAGIAEPLLGRCENRFHRQYMACRRALLAAREKK